MTRNKTFAAVSVAAALMVGTAGLGIAQAGTSPNSSGLSAHTVPATAAGMPPTAQTLFAVVDPTGKIARGFGSVTGSSVGTGYYEVSFRQNVRGCAYSGTVGLSGSLGVSAPGQISVVGANDNVNAVFVATQNSAGTQTPLGFHLTVAC